MPSKWYSGGKGLDTFREDMINDKSISHLFDFEDSRDCFDGVDIAGGVCYFLWNNQYKGKCSVTTISKNGIVTSLRDLNEFETFIRHDKAVQIIHKVASLHEETLDNIVYSRRPFGISSNDVGQTKPFPNSIKLFGSQGESFIQVSSVKNNADLIGKWKVIMSKTSAEHAGQYDKDGKKRIISRIAILEPNTVCTESYLLLSVFDNEEFAQNMVTYVKTAFFRFLMSTILLTQNIAKDKFAFIPVQKWDKPWSDRELYKKYNLLQDEIEYIESLIKPMDNEALFDADETLDPNFGEFNLEECGVKVGDKIVYTPTKQEVVVAENNMVELDGEKYTLAQFTAKYMPRNKRSVSGFCQGPKYFSFNGMTLYKMKEAFKK